MGLYVNTFLSTDGKTSVSYKIWAPDGDAAVKGVLQISHGMCEYVGRYEDFALYLVSLGWVVAGNDHLGHGDTAASDEDLGYFAEKDGYKLLVDDVHTLTGILKEKYPDVPFVLMGHSMGSFIARLYLASYAEELDAAIIMGTGGTKNPTGLGMALASFIAMFNGDRYRSELLKKIAFSGYLKKCGKNAHPASWITKDEERLRKYADDPKCTYTFTVSGYHDLFDMISRVSTEEWAKMIPTDLPILLISGADDPVGDYGKGVGQVAALLTGAGNSKLTVKLVAGDRHEVLNETDRDEVYAYVSGWLDENVLESFYGYGGYEYSAAESEDSDENVNEDVNESETESETESGNDERQV